MTSKKSLATLANHQGTVTSVAFAPDGRLLVTADGSGGLYFWVGSGPQLGQLLAVYLARYSIAGILWQNNQNLLLADVGSSRNKPDIYQLEFEGL